MTPADRLQAAVHLIQEVDRDPRPADAVVSAWFRAHRDLRENERGAISDLLYDVLRHHARLAWWLARHEHPVTPRSRVLAWLALSRTMTRDDIQALVHLTADEMALLKSLQGGSLDHPEMPEDVRGECPPWALAPLRARFGEAFASEMAAMLTPPPLDLRVNPLKSTREAVLADLRRKGLKAEPTPRAPHGVRVAERPALTRVTPLKDGGAEIQDEGSQLVAELVDAHPGDRVVDFCAGAGGKTLAIATAMQNKGAVIACDVSEGRLKRAAERFRHAGLHNIQTRLLSGERDKWVKRHKLSFDRVLVDAPCSGTGAWRRNPDARWRTQEMGLAGLVALQANILDSAARLVKPGGRLVYATCSLLTEENETQVEAFLSTHPDFKLTPQTVIEDSAQADYLSLTPARHGTDGFFAAVMQRQATGTSNE